EGVRARSPWGPPRGDLIMSWMKRVLIYAGLAPFLFIALFPVLWMVITAFKHERDLYSMRGIPFWFYEPPTLKHFHLLFTQTWFGTWFVNTAMVSVCVVVITVATAVPAGYALSRLRARRRDPARGPAPEPSRNRYHRDLRVHARDAGVSLRGRDGRARGSESRHGGAADHADPGRHLLLGLADGRRSPRRSAGGRAVQRRHRPLHPRPHHGRGCLDGRGCSVERGAPRVPRGASERLGVKGA